MVEPLTPDRRRALTRSHLLQAAAHVFARNGFHEASIDDVAAAAGFTKGAVYSNFKNKEDLFLALMDQRTDEQIAAVQTTLEEATTLSSDERAARFTNLTAQLLWGDRDWQLLYLEFALYAARHPNARRLLAERQRRDRERLVPIIEAEFARVPAPPTVSIEDLAAIFLALFSGIGLQHLTNPDDADDTLLQSAIEFLDYKFTPIETAGDS
jgi:AcrR family transcriptional regulator